MAALKLIINGLKDITSWGELMPKLTSYLGGSQMLTTLFRIPAIGLAMYHTSFTKNKKMSKGVLTAFGIFLPVYLSEIVCGILRTVRIDDNPLSDAGNQYRLYPRNDF